MADIYHLDYETFGSQPLGNQKSVGAYRYASDDETEILILAVTKNDEEPVAMSVLDANLDALMLLEEAIESGSLIYAHNAQFEIAITRYKLAKFIRDLFGIKDFKIPHLRQWRCTVAMCRLAAIPSSLSAAGAFLGIEAVKDKLGTARIKKFSVPRRPSKKDPRTRIMPEDEPEEFQMFVDYCLQDVRAEREVHQKLAKFEMKGLALATFQMDIRMNERGIPLNIPALQKAADLMEEYYQRLIPQFVACVATPGGVLTLPAGKVRSEPKEFLLDYGFKPSQVEKVKLFLQDNGYPGDNLQEETVTNIMADPPEEMTDQAIEALRLYSLVNSAAVKKIPTMLRLVCSDGFARGMFKVFGAERTKRWAGSGIQPHNFARPKIKHTFLAYEYLCAGMGIDFFECCFGDFFDVLISVLRHFIQPHEGGFLQADYSAIEARVNPWLCGVTDKLELFKNDEPIYEIMASKIFGVPVEDVVAAHEAGDSAMRFLGKQAELGCGYQMGAPKFRGTCESYYFSPPDSMVEDYIPRHKAFVTAAFKETRKRIVNKYEKKGKMVPPAFLEEEHLWGRTARKHGWFDIYLELYQQDRTKTLLDVEDFEHFRHFCYDELAIRAVTAWREDNPEIVASWKAIDHAAKSAIQNKGNVFTVGRLQFQYGNVGGFMGLRIRLPSGNFLVYPNARLSNEHDDELDWTRTVIKFDGIIPNSGGKWGRCSTYGGKILENCTQGESGNVMKYGMLNADRAGYFPTMTVHDEMLSKETYGQTVEELCTLLCDMPECFDGLPLKAEGQRMKAYSK
jgi:DNA polymerase